MNVKRTSYWIISIICMTLFCQSLLAQTDVKKREIRSQQRKKRHLTDSAWKKDFRITDTSAALVINKIEDINNTLNSFNDAIENGYDTSEISEKLPIYQKNLAMMRIGITNMSGSLNLRNLSLVQDILQDMTDDLKEWQASLISYYTELVSINTQMRTISFDSTMKQLPVDSELRFLYLRQVGELKNKWRSTDTVTKATLARIDRLQTNVSDLHIEALEIKGKIGVLVRTYDKKAFGKEFGYLWESPAADSSIKDTDKSLKRSAKISARIFKYYLADNWEGRLGAIVLTLLFFLWVSINLRKVRTINPETRQKLLYTQQIPILSSLIFLFTIIPFLDLHPPIVVLEMMQFLLGMAMMALLFKKWPQNLFVFWLLLFALFLFHSAKGLMVSSSYSLRIWALVVDLFAILLGFRFIKAVKTHREFFPRYMAVVIYLFIALNAAAIACNIFGRVTLSTLFDNTAISNLVQTLGLVVFIQIFLEAISLQLEADKKSTRFTSYLNHQNVELRLRHVLTLIVGIFWFINLTQNLNIYELIYNTLADFLNTPRALGSSTFTLGSILIFFVVIWISNIFQKYIGYFFGDSTDEIIPDKKTKIGTSILLIRLLILTAGFFVGIVASGIPLDRVTIIIGALGVGIGLGLQNIVNNLVSGVILAIERPIQVGDLIEISSTNGRVKEIGIRSSRIITPDGAEVIIPNGDMLSQKLTNWTLSNSHLRVEIIIKLASGSDADKAKNIITQLLSENSDIMAKPEPQVLIRSVTQTSAELQILFWAFDINKWVQVKSDTVQRIYDSCNKSGITII